jgi:catechol 2,3-dioxygenase
MNTELRTNKKLQNAIHPATRIGLVHHTVTNLDSQVKFYQEVIGLQLHWQKGETAALGAGQEDLLLLTEDSRARRYRGVTGLYHFALLLPDRKELARVIARLYSLRWRNYPTDHIMTKTTYLDDPEGNNIEIYTDTPEDGVFGLVGGVLTARHADGTLSDGREPLDVTALMRNLSPEDQLEAPLPPETRMGHVHLYVADLDASMHFYHDLVGFDNMGLARDFRMAMVSAGGYHHHIGFNTWVGQGAPPPPPGALGLRYFSVVLPEASELQQVVDRVLAAGISTEALADGILVRDPSQNGMLLTSRPGLGL